MAIAKPKGPVCPKSTRTHLEAAWIHAEADGNLLDDVIRSGTREQLIHIRYAFIDAARLVDGAIPRLAEVSAKVENPVQDVPATFTGLAKDQHYSPLNDLLVRAAAAEGRILAAHPDNVCTWSSVDERGWREEDLCQAALAKLVTVIEENLTFPRVCPKKDNRVNFGSTRGDFLALLEEASGAQKPMTKRLAEGAHLLEKSGLVAFEEVSADVD